jgi:DNA polymerase-3 subunit alpha
MMEVIHKMAGISLSDADRIRKVIGKKRDVKEFEPYKEAFVKGCREKKTFTDEQALEFWDGLLEWARYGFSKNHSTAYSIIAYRTAWLKCHFPGEFFAATLSFSEFNEKSRDPQSHKQYTIDEAISAGFYIMPPKKDVSDPIKWTLKDDVLYAPFIEIKGIGKSNAEQCVVVERPQKPKQKGFFNIPTKQEDEETKIQEIARLLMLYDIDAVPHDKILKDYLSFEIHPK